MLMDDILADANLPKEYPGFDAVQTQLRKANKYVLAADFAAAADGLVNNVDQLKRIVPFCRLPAPMCWFELAQADRPNFAMAPMHYEAFQSTPKRVGFFCVAKDPTKLWDFVVILCWSLKHFGNHKPVEVMSGLIHDVGGNPNNASGISVWFNTKDGHTLPSGEYADDKLARYVEVMISPFCPPILRTAFERQNNVQIIQMLQSDWGGEIRYLLAVLGLLNARNVMEVEPVDRSQNKARARHGKPPLCSHTLLKIRAMHRRSFLGTRGKGTSGDIREHFCSGHWKTRKTGIFWWNPHWRGNPEHGRIDHDYEVTT